MPAPGTTGVVPGNGVAFIVQKATADATLEEGA
jgi:hypothetical protein